MTETKIANEFGKVRVFQLAYQLKSEIGEPEDYTRLETAIGVKIVKQEDIQIVSEAALHDLGLAQFLMMGHGIVEDDIAPATAMLNALKGSVAIIRSGAFGPDAVTFPDTGEATWIATFNEQGTAPAPMTPLTSESAEGTMEAAESPAKKPKSDARVGGMIATVALLLMGLLVWLMIWIAS